MRGNAAEISTERECESKLKRHVLKCSKCCVLGCKQRKIKSKRSVLLTAVREHFEPFLQAPR